MTGLLGRRAALAALGAAALVGCGENAPPVVVRGAGATLPHPLYARWIRRRAGLAPRVRVEYQAVGSGAGVRQLLAGMAEFAATDAPFRGAPFAVVHLPTAVGAVALAHRLPGLTTPLRLGPRALGAIFAGEARRWTDEVVARDNPGVALPALPIVPVHRSDGSGTTQIFSEWLARHGAADPTRLRPGMLVRFPSGVGARGSDGVAGVVRRIEGAIGYVETVHARAAGLSAVRLARGDDDPGLIPDEATIAQAAAALPWEDGELAADPHATHGYALAGFSYAVAPRDAADATRATALASFLWWVLGAGQEDCAPLGYQRLPAATATRARAMLARDLRTGGRPALVLD